MKLDFGNGDSFSRVDLEHSLNEVTCIVTDRIWNLI